MAESLETFKSYIGKSETATDVVTASTMVKFAATLGLENLPLEKGSPIPPGWYGGLFPASHRPDKMRPDGRWCGAEARARGVRLATELLLLATWAQHPATG